MSRAFEKTVHTWLDLERSGTKRLEAERALYLAFQPLPMARPSAAFLDRVVADVKRSRDFFDRAWTRAAVAASVALLTLALAMLPVSLMVLGKTLGMVALVDLASEPDDNAARLLRTEGLLATGSLDLARLMTENARRVLPNDTSWQQLAAVVAFRENDLARAEILLRGVLVVEPQNFEALFNLAMVLTAGNQLPEAREAFGIVALRDEFPLAQRRAEVELARLGG